MKDTRRLCDKNLDWAQFEGMIEELKEEESIDLRNNRIERISEKILELKNLRVLDLTHNQLKELPPFLFQLPNLQTLVVSHNQITSIPKVMKDSPVVKFIARVNKISEVDWSVFSNLTTLDLFGNQIKEFVLDVSLPKLSIMTIGNNPVRALELAPVSLPGLKRLSLYTPSDYLSRVAKRFQSFFRLEGNVIYLLKDNMLTGAMDDLVITIDISRDDPSDLREEELIHRTRYHQILDIIQGMMAKGYGYAEEKLRRVHNIITLSGSRGTGKTTLLHSLNKAMETNSRFLDVQPLGMIDPTLIEEKGHIFLNIISMIQTMVHSRINKKEYDGGKYVEWEKTLKDLAGGLPQLDGIQGGLDPGDWNDPQYVMFTGLKAVQSAINLEKNFHRFVRLSLELLEKKFFMLFFDDADNDFSKGWPVLETLRKYLTSPQLIILISGDLDLFSYLVRKKQWTNFGKALLKNEFDQDDGHPTVGGHDYTKMVEELESQYLVKLMSPQYRVTLDSILAKLSRGEHILISNATVNQDASILDVRAFYRNYLTQFWGIQSKMALYDYTNLFLSLPIRSQMELMRVFKRVSPSRESASLNAAKALTDIFYSELKAFETDVWEMVNEYGEINIYILRFLLATKLLDEGSQLYPKLSDVRLDSCLTALGCLLTARFSRSPYEIFDYIIRISYPVSKSHWPLAGPWEDDLRIIHYQSIEGLIDHAYLKYDYGMRKMASLESAYVLSFTDAIPANEGLIPIYALNRFAKEGNKGEKVRIDQLFDPLDLSFTLAMIPTFAVRDSNHERGTYFSFYNLLAAVGQLLLNDITLIDRELHKLTTFRVYPSYFSHDEAANDDDETVEEGDQDVIIDERRYTPLVQEFSAWRKDLETSHVLLPPFVLGRAMVRTQSSFPRIETSRQSVGTLFHRMLVVFLNAMLVEERIEHGSLQGLRLANPVGADSYFEQNCHALFGNMEAEDKMQYFSYHLLNCPLLLAYMDPGALERAGLKVPAYNIYDKLKLLKIKPMGNPKTDTPQKVNRRVDATQEDADLLVLLMKESQMKPEDVNEGNYMDFVKQLFTNKKHPNSKREATLLELIRNSDQW